MHERRSKNKSVYEYKQHPKIGKNTFGSVYRQRLSYAKVLGWAEPFRVLNLRLLSVTP